MQKFLTVLLNSFHITSYNYSKTGLDLEQKINITQATGRVCSFSYGRSLSNLFNFPIQAKRFNFVVDYHHNLTIIYQNF